MYMISMPTVCISIGRVPSTPRMSSWLISLTYTGTMLKQPPAAKPANNLAMMSVVVEEYDSFISHEICENEIN